MHDKNFCSLCDRWFDGDLPEGEREHFEAHLQGCSKCQQRIELLKQLDWDIQAAYQLFETDCQIETSFEPDVSFNRNQHESVVAATSGESNSYRQQTRWVYWLVMAATILVIAGAGWLISSNRNEVTQTAEMSNIATAPLQTETAHTQNQSSSSKTIPQVEVTIKAPAIAAPAYRTEKYTFVQVYPKFTWRDSD